MKIKILLPLLLSYFSVFGQERKLQLHDLKFSHEIEEEISNEKLSKNSGAYYYSYIGNYKQSLKQYELDLDWSLDSISMQDSIDFMEYHPVNSFEYLEDITKNEQVVIISEAHHKPQHRIFTRKLLKSLYSNGFRYLGLETITPSYGDTTQFLMDSKLNQRGFPLNSPFTGFYTREPQMGNLVREALKLGFEIFGYERTGRDSERDLQQAKNIKTFIDKNPKDKVVIHCGWYHAIESNYPKRKKDNYMAYHLKQFTGIDPLTIYQDALTEKQIAAESPFYKLIKSEDISILIDKSGNVFNGTKDQNHFDIFIYHPRTKYLNNRPSWLFEIKGNKIVKVEKQRITENQYPIIVKAYLKRENENATPIDIIELINENDPTQLVLEKGDYRIKIIDKNMDEFEYYKTIK